MSKNVKQIFDANPAASMAATDLYYLGRSPYGATNDMAILWSNVMASITVVGTISTGVWNGSVIDLPYGGSNANLTASNGGVVWSNATQMQILAGTATQRQMLQSGSTASPTWSTATWPVTTTINQILYSSASNVVAELATLASAALVTSAGGVPSLSQTLPAAVQANITQLGTLATPLSPTSGGTGVSNPTAHALPVAEASSAFTFVGPLTNGQLLIGSTGLDPVAANLSAGPGVSISGGAGSITISGTGSGIGWTEVTGATQAMVADNGYVANRATLITFTLPATAAFGTAISVIGKGAGGWLIAQNAGQNIQVGSVSSTVGAGGSVASTNRFDSFDLICTTVNTTFTVQGGPEGNLTIV